MGKQEGMYTEESPSNFIGAGVTSGLVRTKPSSNDMADADYGQSIPNIAIKS